MASDPSKLDTSAHLLETLKKVSPLWSLIIGAVLFGVAYQFNISALYTTSITFLLLGIILWRYQPKSRLVHKEAFKAIRDRYVGREDDAEDLVAAIRKHPLIWVSGESGSGKSSLLRKGVVPRLNAGSDFLPVYIEDWGKDWEAGPISALLRSLRPSVEALNAKMAIPASPRVQDMSEALAGIAALTDRTPVIILDQFDDYMVDNLERLCGSGNGLVITAAELAAQNGFWREIASQLRADKIRVILVVRQEQGWGQSAVTFVGIREFIVGRLANVYVEQILRELSEQAVSEPEMGWIALRELLVRDLGAGAIGGGVLPIQMRLVIQQLSSLPSLTINAYRKAGSTLGLAVQHCREVVEQVAVYAAVKPEVVKHVLGSLVSPDDHSKTRDVDHADLFSMIGSRTDAAALDKVLERLKSVELARERADESGRKRWRLDHDYLATVVHELITEDNPCLRALQEASDHLREAGLWKSFAKPLPLKTMGKAFWDASRGRVSLARYGKVIYMSLVAKFAFVILGICYIAVITAFDGKEDLTRTAASYTRRLLDSHQFDHFELAIWVSLSREPLVVRRLVELNLLESRTGTEKLLIDNRRARTAAVALAGLSSDVRSSLVVLAEDCNRVPIPGKCVFLASQLGQDSLIVGLHAFASGQLDSLNPELFHDLGAFVTDSQLVDACLNHLIHSVGFPIATCRELDVQPSTESVNALRLAFDSQPAAFRGDHALPDEVSEPDFEFKLRKWLQTDPAHRDDHPSSAEVRILTGPTDKRDGDDPARTLFRVAAQARQHHSAEFAYLASGMTGNVSPELVKRVGMDMLHLGQIDSECYYYPGFVTALDIPTALSAVESPACADRLPQIQKAITTQTGYKPDVARNRWLFAEKWVMPNARRYDIQPDRFNNSAVVYLYRQLPYIVRTWIERASYEPTS